MNKNSKQRRLIYERFKFVYKGKEYFLLTGKTYKLTADELKKAKNFIFLEYFIIEQGEVWDSVLDRFKR